MAKKIPDFLIPSNSMKFFQHAIQFYNAAKNLRKTTVGMQAIDYLLAISFELALKAIMTARGQFDRNKHYTHNLLELYSLCGVLIDTDKEYELIDYLCVVLTKLGRYPVLSSHDRELLDSKLKNAIIVLDDEETIARYGKKVSWSNPDSGINDETYKRVWEKLNIIYHDIAH